MNGQPAHFEVYLLAVIIITLEEKIPIQIIIFYPSGFPGIYINGDGSPIVVVDGTPLTLDFTLWQLPPISQAVRACEILANGSRVSSNKLLIRIGLRNDDTCYNPFADTLGPAVSIVRAYLNPGSLIPGSTSRVFLSQGTCADVMVDSDVITSK